MGNPSPDVMLSFDGGGVRGVGALEFAGEVLGWDTPLSEIEAARDGRFWLAGTSTGAIIAALLASGRTVRQAMDLYMSLAERAFPPSTKAVRAWRYLRTGAIHNPLGLQEAARSVFGGETLGQYARLMIQSYDLTLGKPVTLWGGEDPEIRIVDAVLASAAAPTFLPPHRIGMSTMWDGGVANNNPALPCLDALHDAEFDLPEACVSFGCGRRIRARTNREMMALKGLDQAREILEAAMETESGWDAACNLLARSVRLQFEIPAEVGRMDDASRDNLERIRIAARKSIGPSQIPKARWIVGADRVSQ